MNTALRVNMGNSTAGYLSWDDRRKVALFEYDTAFLKQELDIAPLTMPVFAERSQKQLVWFGNEDKLYRGLHPIFADSLPDKWGSTLFVAWMKANDIKTKSITPLDHLCFIGSRAMGALEYEPALKFDNQEVSSIDVQKLYEFSKEILSNRQEMVLNKENSVLWQDLIKISTSPGGKRPKAIVAINENTGAVVSGQTAIPNDFKHYILKYDDNSAYPYAKIEYVYYKMACDAGINIMPSFLKTYGSINHFLTQRFDRNHNEKIHTQTLAAIQPLAESYEDIFAVIRTLKLPYEDLKQMYIRMVFNVLAKNIDDHNKNFSFMMDKNGIWRLAPAYDLTFSVDLSAPSYMNRHIFSVNGKFENITSADLELVGKTNDIRNYKNLTEQVREAVAHFQVYATQLDMDKKLTDRIYLNLMASL